MQEYQIKMWSTQDKASLAGVLKVNPHYFRDKFMLGRLRQLMCRMIWDRSRTTDYAKNYKTLQKLSVISKDAVETLEIIDHLGIKLKEDLPKINTWIGKKDSSNVVA